jgi:hypothetical protein
VAEIDSVNNCNLSKGAITSPVFTGRQNPPGETGPPGLENNGLLANMGNNGLKVYPNPSQSLFYVTVPPSLQTNVELYNVFGEKIVNFEISNAKQFVIDAGIYNLSNGMYYLVVRTNVRTYTEKLIFNH